LSSTIAGFKLQDTESCGIYQRGHIL